MNFQNYLLFICFQLNLIRQWYCLCAVKIILSKKFNLFWTITLFIYKVYTIKKIGPFPLPVPAEEPYNLGWWGGCSTTVLPMLACHKNFFLLTLTFCPSTQRSFFLNFTDDLSTNVGLLYLMFELDMDDDWIFNCQVKKWVLVWLLSQWCCILITFIKACLITLMFLYTFVQVITA